MSSYVHTIFIYLISENPTPVLYQRAWLANINGSRFKYATSTCSGSNLIYCKRLAFPTYLSSSLLVHVSILSQKYITSSRCLFAALSCSSSTPTQHLNLWHYVQHPDCCPSQLQNLMLRLDVPYWINILLSAIASWCTWSMGAWVPPAAGPPRRLAAHEDSPAALTVVQDHPVIVCFW